MGKGKHYTSNEMRSRSMNRQDSMGQAAIANHKAQTTPDTPEFKSSRDTDAGSEKSEG